MPDWGGAAEGVDPGAEEGAAGTLLDGGLRFKPGTNGLKNFLKRLIFGHNTQGVWVSGHV